MDMPASTTIPVYISRFTPNLPKGYGALISWNKGERCKVVSTQGNPTVNATLVDGELKWHNASRIIESALGKGKWILEVIFEGEDKPCAIPADQIILPE